MRTAAQILIRRIGALLVTLAAGAVLTAAMVRFSPGFGTDERALDPRLNEASRLAIQQEHDSDSNLPAFFATRLQALLHGDLGESRSLRRPIGQLLRERAGVTAEVMAIGVVGGWALAFALAMPAVLGRRAWLRSAAGLSQEVLMCLPAAALAIVVFRYGGPVRALVAAAVCPRVFQYLRNLLQSAYAQPHILTARAKGLGGVAIWARYVMPCIAPQLLALAGVSVSIAFGAAIPVEALCDLPGIGQLAWMAAVSRDLPLLVTITFLVIALTQTCNAFSDYAATRGRPA